MESPKEIGRLGRPGVIDATGTGWLISAPAVYNFGTEEMRRATSQQGTNTEINTLFHDILTFWVNYDRIWIQMDGIFKGRVGNGWEDYWEDIWKTG